MSEHLAGIMSSCVSSLVPKSPVARAHCVTCAHCVTLYRYIRHVVLHHVVLHHVVLDHAAVSESPHLYLVLVESLVPTHCKRIKKYLYEPTF